MNNRAKIRKLHADELDWANACYKRIDFKISSEQDFVAVAELNEQKVGLGRLVSIDGNTGELGGMHVFPEYQGRAIAGDLVEFLISCSRFSKLYCIPFSRLVGFYEWYGFSEISTSSEIPTEILQKYNWCNEFYPEPVSLMCRTADNFARVDAERTLN